MLINKGNIYLNVLFITVGCNIVLNYGFSNFGIKVGVVIPLSQVLMLIGFFQILIRNQINRRFALVLLFCLYAYVRLFFDMIILNKGIFSLRDATNYMDIMFVIIAYGELKMLYRREINVKQKFDKTLEIVYVIAIIYVFTSYIPGADFMKRVSLSYSGQQGSITFLGFYSAVRFWICVYMFYCYYLLSVKHKDINRKKYLFYGILGSICFLTNTGRTYWLVLLIILIYLFFTRTSKYMVKFYISMFIVLFLFLIIVTIGIATNNSYVIHIVTDITNIFLSMIGLGSNAAKVGGFNQRINWFARIFRIAFTNINTLIFGQGFGVSLTNFVSASGTLVREPHNSFISIFARLGIIGEVIWLVLVGRTFSILSNSFKCRNTPYASFGIFMLLAAFVMANTEPFFEQSYCAMPFYALLGCVIFFVEVGEDDRTSSD